MCCSLINEKCKSMANHCGVCAITRFRLCRYRKIIHFLAGTTTTPLCVVMDYFPKTAHPFVFDSGPKARAACNYPFVFVNCEI